MCFVSSFVINWQFKRIDHNGSRKSVSVLSPRNCTYNSHVIRNENLFAYFMRILNSRAVYKFQTVKPECPPSQRHTFWSTANRRDIRAALRFCSCELRQRSTECVLLLCFNALPDIFAVMNCSVFDTADNLRSLQWQVAACSNE